MYRYMLASGIMPDKDYTVNEDVAKKIKPPAGAKPKICTIKVSLMIEARSFTLIS
jgi:hypothetical protein